MKRENEEENNLYVIECELDKKKKMYVFYHGSFNLIYFFRFTIKKKIT